MTEQARSHGPMLLVKGILLWIFLLKKTEIFFNKISTALIHLGGDGCHPSGRRLSAGDVLCSCGLAHDGVIAVSDISVWLCLNGETWRYFHGETWRNVRVPFDRTRSLSDPRKRAVTDRSP